MPTTSYHFKPKNRNTRTLKKNNMKRNNNASRKNSNGNSSGNANKKLALASALTKSHLHSYPSGKKLGFTNKAVNVSNGANNAHKKTMPLFNLPSNKNQFINYNYSHKYLIKNPYTIPQ
jgi:hypothetical protein